MATYTFDKIEYGSNTYVVSDSGALQLTGGTVTGPVTFGDSISADEATLGSLVVNGNASFTNNISANTINGVEVGSSPKFTDTNTEVSTLTLASGSTAGTSLSYGGKYTLTAGSKTVSFTMPASDNTNTTYALSGALSSHKFTSTLTAGGSGSGTSTTDFTLAAGTGITITDDATNRKMTIACSVTDTNTTYALSNALSSHKFTSTLTAGGSGSGTSTATMEFVAGTGITLTDDTTNKKITIASSLTVPTITLNGSSTTSPSFYAPTGAGTSGQYLKSNGSGAPSWTNFPTIPTKVSDLTNDSGFITSYTETDPVFSASAAAGITATDISNWNGKSDTDEKVKQVPLASGDQNIYRLILGPNSSETVIREVNTNNRLTYDPVINTLSLGGNGVITSTQIEGQTIVANGNIIISKGASPWYEASMTASSITANRSYSLPDGSGTIALTSDVFSSTTASLTTSGWSSNSQTVSVTGVTASNTVIVSPAPASYDTYCEAGIYCSAQGAGTLTFTCDTVPSSALTVNILYK